MHSNEKPWGAAHGEGTRISRQEELVRPACVHEPKECWSEHQRARPDSLATQAMMVLGVVALCIRFTSHLSLVSSIGNASAAVKSNTPQVLDKSGHLWYDNIRILR